MLDTHARKFVDPIILKTGNWLVNKNVSANQITVIAFFIGVSASVLIFYQQPFWAVVLLWFSGFLDAVDGSMARLTKMTSFGTVLDVTFDRIVEISIIVTLALVFPDVTIYLLFLSVAIIFSMTVFLTVGAVSERKGKKSFYYQAGIAERTEGFILFSLMILFPAYIVDIVIVFAVLVTFTGGQRLFEAMKLLK